jgi:hypothetical protein
LPFCSCVFNIREFLNAGGVIEFPKIRELKLGLPSRSPSTSTELVMAATVAFDPQVLACLVPHARDHILKDGETLRIIRDQMAAVRKLQAQLPNRSLEVDAEGWRLEREAQALLKTLRHYLLPGG